jgi:hypothetical protein
MCVSGQDDPVSETTRSNGAGNSDDYHAKSATFSNESYNVINNYNIIKYLKHILQLGQTVDPGIHP